MSQEKQDRFIEHVISILKAKGYYGVDISTPYILPQDLELYVDFIAKFSGRIKSEGFLAFVTINLDIFVILTGTKYIGMDYERLSQVVDRVMLVYYEKGNIVEIPTGLVAFDTMKVYFHYIVNHIPPEKTLIGIPVLGYVWERPFIPCVTRGLAITNSSAIELASNAGATIQYDEITKSSYFQYIYQREYIARFRDARSVDAYVKLVPENAFNGIGIWNIMSFFSRMWLVINSQYEIAKIQDTAKEAN